MEVVGSLKSIYFLGSRWKFPLKHMESSLEVDSKTKYLVVWKTEYLFYNLIAQSLPVFFCF